MRDPTEVTDEMIAAAKAVADKYNSLLSNYIIFKMLDAALQEYLKNNATLDNRL